METQLDSSQGYHTWEDQIHRKGRTLPLSVVTQQLMSVVDPYPFVFFLLITHKWWKTVHVVIPETYILEDVRRIWIFLP